MSFHPKDRDDHVLSLNDEADGTESQAASVHWYQVLQRHIITVQSKWECQPAAPPPGSDAICCGLGGEREDFSGCRQELKQGDQLPTALLVRGV